MHALQMIVCFNENDPLSLAQMAWDVSELMQYPANSINDCFQKHS